MKTKRNTLKNMCQTIIITFSDGKVATYTGQVHVFPGDTRKIIDIKFTEPKELPKDCYFESISNQDDLTNKNK